MATEQLEALRAAILEDPEVPETVRRFLARGAELEEIRLDAEGRWWHRGEPFENARLIALFSRSLHQTSRGSWVLRIAPYTYPILVEVTGYFVDALVDRAAEPLVRLSDGSQERLALESLVTDGERFVAARVHQGAHWARLRGAAYQRLLEELDEDEEGWSVQWAGRRHRLRRLSTGEPLAERLAARR